jgi:DNA-directed RNA polymerase subunit M/transcription elongation factor TFIIS
MDNHITLFTSKKYLTKLQSIKLVECIYDYCNTYANDNNTPFLLDSIIDTKVEEILYLFQKNNYLKNLIKKKQIKIEDVCYLKQEELDPEKFKDIIEQRELEESKKNEKTYTDLYKCSKCGERKCYITQKQTRAADEAQTTFVECVVCGFVFRF